jgi:two-component system, cell cycle sensor histidine kinase and response regulator CckA
MLIDSRVADSFSKEGEMNRLHQSQKSKAIGTLAGGIAHDFNNILGVIIGYSELALMNPTEAENNIKEVIQAAGRARDLVKRIRASSPPLE